MENDEAFQRVKTMLQNLIDEAEAALTQKTKLSGKVLTDYHQMDEDLKEYASLFRDDKDEGKEDLEIAFYELLTDSHQQLR